MSRVARKRLIGLSVESIVKCACPVSWQGIMSSPLTEVFPWGTAYVREQLDAGDTLSTPRLA